MQKLAATLFAGFCRSSQLFGLQEKLEIMIQLANDRNIDQVLLEFKEYAAEVDVDFVRKASSSSPGSFCSFYSGTLKMLV